MPNTPNLDLPYPAGGTAPNVPYDLQALAEAVDDRIASAPYRECSGTVAVSAVLNTAVTAAIAFPAGRFTVTPLVYVTQATTAPQLNSISGSATSTTVGSVTVYRTSASATVNVAWRAVQMTESSAAG